VDLVLDEIDVDRRRESKITSSASKLKY